MVAVLRMSIRLEHRCQCHALVHTANPDLDVQQRVLCAVWCTQMNTAVTATDAQLR